MNVLNRRKAGAVGQVLSGVTVHILDPDGNSLPAGEEGEICCRYVRSSLFGVMHSHSLGNTLTYRLTSQWAECDEGCVYSCFY